MKAIFKGNKFIIQWTITDAVTSLPFDFTGMFVEYILYSDSYKGRIVGATTNINKMQAEIPANILPVGVYNIICKYRNSINEGHCIYRNAFQITRHPEYIGCDNIVIIESFAAPLKLENMDINYIGHFPSEELLPDCNRPSWALVGNLKEAAPYFFYMPNSVPPGYQSGWNNLSGILGTYNLTEDKVSIYDFNLITEYNVSRNHTHTERKFSTHWGATTKYYPEYEEYLPCKIYEKDERVNMPGYTENSFIALHQTSDAPFEIVNETSEFSFFEAINLVPDEFRFPGIRMTYVNKDTHQAETWFYKGGPWDNQSSWIKSESVTINNLPDDEDIVSIGENVPVLKFKDKSYNPQIYSGLGRKYLRKNIVDGINVLSQSDFVNEDGTNRTNTRYIIQYDYDLNGATITIPEGCVLDFQGGSFSNGIIIGNNTEITDVPLAIFNSIKISGSWNVPYIHTKMFYSLDGANDLRNIIALSNADIQNTIIIEDKGTPYLFDFSVNEEEGLKLNSNTNLIINGHIKLLPNKFSNYYLVSAYNVSNVKISGNGIIEGDKYTHISDGGEWGHCIRVTGSTDITIEGLKICNAWGDCIDISESNNVIVSNSLIEEGRRQGVSVIGANNVIIENCQIKHVGGTDPQSAIDYEPNAGQISYNLSIRNCIIEDCLYGIISYVPSSSSAHLLSIENCNIQDTYGAVAINGVSNCVIKNSILKSSKQKENSDGELVYNSSVVSIANTNTSIITGCTIEGLTSCAIFPSNNGRISIECNDIICDKGIRACSNAEIKNNKFVCTSLIYIENATISNTIIENNIIDSGITLKSSNTYLNNNKITGNLSISGTYATISENNILGNISLSGSYHKIIGNTLDGYFKETSAQDIVVNNTFKNYLTCNSSGGKISNNTILSYVYLRGENIYFHNNHIETSIIGDNGYVTYILMSESEKTIISSNVISYIGDVSVKNIIVLIKKYSSCINNIIYTNDLCEYVIHLLESDNVISGNKITGTASSRLIGPAVDNTYYNNINYANKGVYSKLPTIEDDNIIHDESVLGFTYYITDYNMPGWWNGYSWLDSEGNKIKKKKGTTEERPASPSTGHLYYDTSLKKPIWWDGEKWCDATGIEV